MNNYKVNTKREHRKCKGFGCNETTFSGHFLVNISIRIIKFLLFSPGQKIGCLTEIASKDLGLDQNTSVACGLIDAHAGALGLMATIDINDFSKTLGMICGTSTCHMILNKTKIRIPGVWGPYYSGKIFVY